MAQPSLPLVPHEGGKITFGGKVTENKALTKNCRVWQKILRLQDWDVTIGYARSEEFSEPGRLGETAISFNNKAARIKILDAEGRKLGGQTHPEEAILVHELLHLHFEQILNNVEPRFIDRCQVEQSIESIASGFIKLKEMLTCE